MPIVSFWLKTSIPLANLLMAIEHCIIDVVQKKNPLTWTQKTQHCCCDQVVDCFFGSAAADREVEEVDGREVEGAADKEVEEAADDGEMEEAGTEKVEETADSWRLEDLAAIQEDGHMEVHYVYQEEAEEEHPLEK